MQSPEEYLDELLATLVSIANRCMDLAERVPLRSRTRTVQGKGKAKSTLLAPSEAQQCEALTTYQEYSRWLDTVVAFVARLGEKRAEELRELGKDFGSYLLLSRVGHDIPAEEWRRAFRREVQQMAGLQVQLLRKNLQAFSILRPRQRLDYRHFLIRIGRRERSRYKVEVVCDVGEKEQSFRPPFNDSEVERFVLKHCVPRGKTRAWAPALLRPLTKFGEEIFQALLSGSVRDLYMRARELAEARGSGLRICLSSSSPDLVRIPWELLYDGSSFLSLSSATPVTRHLISSTSAVTTVKSPIRVLVTISRPSDAVLLSSEEEQEKIQRALAPLTVLGRLCVDFSPDGTLRTLQRMLRQAESERRPYSIWHYIGHGEYDDRCGAGFLIFEDARGCEAPVSGFELGTLFAGYRELQLAFLNACSGAKTSREDVFSGIGTALVAQGLSAVIAMQFEISDEAAMLFSEEFYASLVDGLPVDAAVTEARRALFFAPNYTEWLTPILFMRSAGLVIDLDI